MAVDRLRYTERGPEYDREWVVVDANGKFVSQRTVPKMCLIQAKIEHDCLKLGVDGVPGLKVKDHAEERTVRVWNDTVTGSDCGDPAAEWLSDFLGQPCRLVRVNANTQRLVDPEFNRQQQTVGFADGFPTLIVSQASLDEFNSHLESPIDMRRFRPNIVISGCAPYAEDQWQRIRISGIEFDLVKPCSRCIMPSINPDTGAKEMVVNDVLMATRRRDRQTFFGQNALHDLEGEIFVGDSVELIR